MNRLMSSRERTLLVLALLAAFIFVSVRLVIGPFRERRQTTVETIERTEHELLLRKKEAREGRMYQKKHADILDLFRQRDPDERVMSALLSEIEAAAGTDVRVADMKPSRVKREGPEKHFSVNVVVDGALVPITRFIHQLQSEPHFLGVEEFRLEKRSSYGEELRCSLVFSRVLVSSPSSDERDPAPQN